MNNSVFKVIKNQVEIIENNYEDFKEEFHKVVCEVNDYFSNEKLKKEEKEKLLEMRFDLKRIRNILNQTDGKLI